MSNIVKNNYINKSWFYLLDDNSPSVIDVMPGVYWVFFTKNTTKPFTINLEENSKVDFYGYFSDFSSKKILFNQMYENSILNVKTMYFCNKNELSTNIKSYTSTNNSKSNIQIINIIKDNKLNIDSSIEIEKDSKNVEGHLSQNNIFISDKWSVRWLPKLFVRSDDIKASHSCKMQSINQDELFYLTSRWLDKTTSTKILTQSYFNNIFSCISMYDKKIYDELFLDFSLSI